jgi:sugar phosphate isomerase/epimerase
MYTLREFCKTPEGIAQSLKKIREIGYDAFQSSGFGPIDPQELKDIMDREGLTMCATHISFDRLENDIDNVIKEHKLWNCKYVGVGSMPGKYSQNREGFVEFAKLASKYAKILKDNGLQFIYHNHDHEFTRFDGKTGLQLLLDECDRNVFDFEIDTFWVQAGGGSPSQWIRKVRNNMKVVHFKDMVMGSKDGHVQRLMAEVGEGNLDWASIIEACRDIGVEWYVVEQDVCQRDPFESLAISLKNLKAMGLE